VSFNVARSDIEMALQLERWLELYDVTLEL